MQTSTDILNGENAANPDLTGGESDNSATASIHEALVNFDPETIGSLTRIQDRLILLFKDGSQLTIENFFRFEARYQQYLAGMAPGGDILSALQEDHEPKKQLKYNFSQPVTALVFTGSAILAGAALSLFL
ncbi:Uncharacterised protein [Halioglobus japonicus]|nr:Uncharacterised protein [Halioglobus japonicus]